ncbi:hypothetical protein V494_01540 [Pseudogymnoascus sp. VKM F-4513 (FW-928)]|nr:hypothetical protein V494_01540 [Pseudogymnoascus sp. VKM F-4513 (FW-928)]
MEFINKLAGGDDNNNNGGGNNNQYNNNNNNQRNDDQYGNNQRNDNQYGGGNNNQRNDDQYGSSNNNQRNDNQYGSSSNNNQRNDNQYGSSNNNNNSSEGSSNQSGGGGFLDGLKDKMNTAAGGGRESEKNEDMLDKGIDYVQEKFMGQGKQDNESAIEQAKDGQIADFIRSQYKGSTGSDFPIADKKSSFNN